MKTRREIKPIQYDTLYNYRDLPTELKRMAREQCIHFVTEPLENAGIIDPKIIKEDALSMAKEVAWFINWDFIHKEIILDHYGDFVDKPEPVPPDCLHELDGYPENRPDPNLVLKSERK